MWSGRVFSDPRVDVFGYSGNGVVELADAAAGSFLTRLTNVAPVDTENAIEVTAHIQAIVDIDASHAGFTFRQREDQVDFGFRASDYPDASLPPPMAFI